MMILDQYGLWQLRLGKFIFVSLVKASGEYGGTNLVSKGIDIKL